MKIAMQKVHGSENDFFLIDETILPRKLKKEELEKLRLNLCDRENGLLGGADGILLIQEVINGTALAKMRVINSDGSEASMCGNGLRAVARYLAEKHHKDHFMVETMFAELKVRRAPNLSEKITTYQVEISPVSFDAENISMNKENRRIINEIIPELSDSIKFSAVAVPNPHLIAFVGHDLLESDEFERIALYVNSQNSLFPDGINVSFVEVLDENQLFVRTYERGVGFTNACGTAMSASSLMYVLLQDGEFYETITVKNTGGLVKTVVHEDRDGSYWMELIGNATVTHELTGECKNFMIGEFEEIVISETKEQEEYLAFLKKIENH